MYKNPLDILKQYWGYDAFRSLQGDIIQSVLDGHDTLALMPTGGGKSLCFQVPALCMPGVCIVVSPLIALMKDQVHNLKKVGVSTAAIYSGMSKREIDIIFDNCVHGHIKLLYLSPERLQTELAQERIRKMSVNMFAIDEAHCISQWGYDFRPSYLQIAEIRKLHPSTPVLALTATATPRVVHDIQEKLQFKEKRVLQKSFYRDNLAYIVVKETDKRIKMLEVLKRIPGTGIVYVNSRKMTKEVARFLLKEGISANYYHAGLNKEERSLRQDDWIKDKTRIMVATNAFGMGIDHPRVRIVVHLSPPASLEAYFQEAGRGGRDGNKAYAILLYDDKDIPVLHRNLEQSFPDIDYIKRVYRALGSYYQLATGSSLESLDFDLIDFCERFKLEVPLTHHALKILQDYNYLYLSDSVFIPSRIFIQVDRQQLYDYLLRNEQLADMLRILLRLYQGIQDQAVAVDEYRLASLLGIKREKVVSQLSFLAGQGMIEYLPAKDQPQLGFVGERLTADQLYIDVAGYHERKKWRKEMLEGVIAYLWGKQCRSQLLLAYFGEENESPCGSCDVCLHEKRMEKWKAILPELNEKILSHLRDGPAEARQILSLFPLSQQKAATFALQELCNEEFLIKEGQNYQLADV